MTKQGYVVVRVPPDGYAYEHRLVAERMLGRPLTPGEVVHHRDGDKANNDPANLEVKEKREHDREHTAGYWAAKAGLAGGRR